MHALPVATAAATSSPARRYDELLGALARRVVSQATGLTIPQRTRLPDAALKRLWLGMLASEPKLIAEAQAGYTYGERLVPPAQGFTFRVQALPVTLTFTVSCAAYLALHPTLAEQQAAVTADTESDQPSPAVVPGPAAPAPPAGRGHKLAQVWTKIAPEPVTVTITLPSGTRGTLRAGEDTLTTALAVATRAPGGSEPFRPRRLAGPPGTLPRADDLTDTTTWARYSAQNLLETTDVTPPVFQAALELDVTDSDGHVEILATVVNTTPAPEQQTVDGVHAYDPTYLDTQLYEVQLICETDAPLVPYELEQVAHSYRYDRDVTALGHGCPVDATTGPTGSRLATLFAAEHATSRVYPRTSHTRPNGVTVAIDTSFTTVKDDPVTAVQALLAAHREWIEREWSPAALDARAAARGWDAAARADANADAAQARAEVDWVADGLDLLRRDPAVAEAFALANQVITKAAGGAYDAWYPFQLAWIVGCLPGMVDPAKHPCVEIVWFATGGGKSEAYLGLMITTLFYGRLTGTTAGAQVWARFPLRLLALQQMERVAAMVLQAELLRRDHPRIAAGDPFGIGYFVGGTNTPNRLQSPDPTNPFYNGLDPRDTATAERCRVLAHCPLCQTPLEVAWNETRWTMEHICRNAGCRMHGVLPVWGIDDEIYRHAPAVLVGTVDKLAQLGQSREFQVLLGRAHSRCPQHGYTSNPFWCAVFNCPRKQEQQPIPDGFGHIRLEIADELHLLDESLGALDGMYETLLQAISEDLGNSPMQIVGATATIEGYQNQVRHLYRRDGHRFPVNGPDVGETFWSTTVGEEPLRRYLGVRPRAITMVTATREVALTHAGWLADLLLDPGTVLAEAGLDPTDSDLQDDARAAGRDLFEVLVAYGLRNEDLNNFVRDQEVRALLSSQDNLAIINGDAEPGDIRSAVARLVCPPDDNDDRVKLIAATRAIGHGFDVARLGVMAVMGTPTSAAEIIQASARVGRRWPGLVVNVINPTRDRDASVFRYYADWIRFLDRLVHKVPVNRESLPVLKRVLSGGLMAWLLQVHDRSWLTGGPRRRSLTDSIQFKDACTAGYLDRALLIDNLTRGFGISPVSVYHQLHRDAITEWVDNTLSTLPLSAEPGKRLPDLLTPAVPRSLRDVEEPITIYADL
ncbi:hypothetical protein [Kutzneria sp. CA-103260]|uniref:hypothetical protein n=1 Tax=Kutzneria sp. CA-103260 TaxID=2802641 RepID=UPI001BA7CCB1|nr:hypothetical protein [Kutzneria sp. CA-103260]QUQ64577.1 hypothetical protein JJ691_22970 [Kutzneria sp. CA-103260]